MTELPHDPAGDVDERTTLVEFLDFYRAVFARKCEGLTDEQGLVAACPPSNLTITGLARHMADVERGWFRRAHAGEEVAPIFYSVDDPERDIEVVAGDSLAEALAAWRAEVDVARANVTRFALDDLVSDGDRSLSVRWIVVHMIEEYARHCGHLDLLREAIDGRTGD